MELAVNMPEQHPQVGQACCSICATSLSPTLSSADLIMASIKSKCCPFHSPASIGPPETNTVGIFSLIAAISIPGVILSQLLMQTIASALWAFTIYSTLSAMIRSEEHTSELQSRFDLVCRLL